MSEPAARLTSAVATDVAYANPSRSLRTLIAAVDRARASSDTLASDTMRAFSPTATVAFASSMETPARNRYCDSQVRPDRGDRSVAPPFPDRATSDSVGDSPPKNRSGSRLLASAPTLTVRPCSEAFLPIVTVAAAVSVPKAPHSQR